MNNFAKEITLIDIEEELKNSYLDYAMSVIIGRALPDVRDGLKPVHRRILFAMKILGNDWNKPYKKSARIVGDVIGKYHPHGDNAVYETIVRMAQNFSLRYALIDGQGNFGSIDGDNAAAMRYTEIRMSKISHELLKDLEKNTVDFIPNYDSSENMPDILPTRIPNILINGSSGIAVGMATNIPPHNLSEIIDGCLAFIDNEKISTRELMKYIPGPDFPTAAIISNTSGIEQAYRTGKGKIYIRAKIELEQDLENSKKCIIINEIPYQVNKSRLIQNIATLIKEKKIDGISNLRDESDKDGMRIVIELKKDTSSKIILNKLYSLTQLQISFGINMVALFKGKPKIFSLKEILRAFVNHRKEVIFKRSIFDLNKAKKKIHILKALILAIYNIDEIINIIRNSNDLALAKSSLLSRKWNLNINNNSISNNIKTLNKYFDEKDKIFNGDHFLTDIQAQSILDLRIYKLTNMEKHKLFDKYYDLFNRMKNLSSILDHPEKLNEILKNELLYLKKEYSDARRTKIVIEKSDINLEDLINKEDVVVTLSYNGYIKYQPIKDYEAQRRGGKGKSAVTIKGKDFINKILVTNTHNTIMLFSNLGRIYWMKVYQLPEASRIARGKPIVNLLPLKNKERITAILPLKIYKEEYNIFMSTSKGIVKKTSLIEFSRPRNNGIIAINLKDNDELIGVDLTDGTNDIMLFSAYGKVVRFKEVEVRSMGRTATGVKGINLSRGDKVVSLIVPKNIDSILTVTKNGYGKCTLQKEYPIKSRGTKGVISIKVGIRNGEVVGSVPVNKKDQIMMITDVGTLVRIRVSEMNIIGRNTKGVVLIRTTKNESVVGLQRINNDIKKIK